MRNYLLTAVTAVLLITPAAMARPVRAQAAPPPSAPQPPPAYSYDKAPWWMKESVITQTGYVFSEVPANRASFWATFQTTDDDLSKAQAKATDQTRALQQVLDKLGKDAVRVTTSFSVRALYEEYRDKNGNRIEDQRADKINGYQVSLTLSVEIRDMSQLEKAYALVLAAAPSSASDISFSLQPSNEMNTWLYNEAIKDAHARAGQGAASAGAKLGEVKVIDPTGRACETDILARAPADSGIGGITADDVGAFPDYNVAEAVQRVPPPPPPPPPPPQAPAAGSAEYLEYMAMKNPFIQTPPLQRLTATACVVYGLE